MFADTSVALQAEASTPKSLKPKSRKELKNAVEEHIEKSADDEDDDGDDAAANKDQEIAVCKKRKHESSQKTPKKKSKTKTEVRLDRLACTKN